MKVENITLEKKYHSAVEHWTKHNFKDYPVLLEEWDRYFPTDEKFCLCAKMELGTPELIQIGEFKGEQAKENQRAEHAQLDVDLNIARRVDFRLN